MRWQDMVPLFHGAIWNKAVKNGDGSTDQGWPIAEKENHCSSCTLSEDVTEDSTEYTAI